MFDTIISASQLQELQASGAPLMVFDCSFDLANTEAGEAAFASSRIAGARYVHLERHLSHNAPAADAASGGRHPLPTRGRFAAWLASMGFNANMQAVVYDRNGTHYCGRMWWMLQWCGHADVAVLDGGLAAWQAAGGATESGAAQDSKAARKGDFDAHFSNKTPDVSVKSSLFTIENIVNCLTDGAHTIIDARAAPRYRGEVEPLDPVAGHIPGALNRPFTSNFDANGCFKKPAQLRAEFDALLAGRPLLNVVHHCGSGVTANPNVIAMALAGYPRTGLFAGSWSEWSRRTDLPVATGA